MTQTSHRKMRLLSFPLGAGSHIAGWRHPAARDVRVDDPDYYRHLAQTAERGLFDAMFLADSQGFRSMQGRHAFSRTDVLRLDALTILSAAAAWTTHLGLIGTVSTSYNEPYGAARRLASLDILSRGRAGWNVVTSTSENEAHNFGRDMHFEHDERYARAAEFLEVCKGLWDSFDDDAVVCDQESGRYFDPDKAHGLAHKGKHFSVAGPLTTPRSPQGYPVIVQAGSSEAGLTLAAATAEVVFTTSPELATARRLYRDIKDRVAAAGRNPDHCLVMPALHPIVADTEAQAKAILAELNELVHPDVAISALQQSLGGVDLSGYDLNGPLPAVPETNRNRTVRARTLEIAERENLTILQLARRICVAKSSLPLAGDPDQVADVMQEWFETGAADGFAVSGPVMPWMLDSFVDKVVPVLQARGLFRTAYEGTTLRENLGLPRPSSRHEGRPELHVEPEIWLTA